MRRPEFDPWVGRSSGEENSYPFQYSCWRIPWTVEPGRLQSMGSQRVGHDWATNTFTIRTQDNSITSSPHTHNSFGFYNHLGREFSPLLTGKSQPSLIGQLKPRKANLVRLQQLFLHSVLSNMAFYSVSLLSLNSTFLCSYSRKYTFGFFLYINVSSYFAAACDSKFC